MTRPIACAAAPCASRGPCDPIRQNVETDRHEKHYRRIMGYEHLWVLKAFLDEPADQKEIAKKRRAG
jgi:hypothetical protein